MGGWLVQGLHAPDPQFAGSFGSSVAIDGDVVVIGAQREAPGLQGAAYIYYRDNGNQNNWILVKRITASDPGYGDAFGTQVSVSGSTIAVSAPGWGEPISKNSTGAVYIFERNHGGIADSWGEVVRNYPPNDPYMTLSFGTAISLDTDTLAVGTYGRAEVYIY